jgi:hypothetical protein
MAWVRDGRQLVVERLKRLVVAVLQSLAVGARSMLGC